MKFFLEWMFWRVAVGLGQVIVLAVILASLGHELQWLELLDNSVLLFFATAVMGSSIHRILTRPNLQDRRYILSLGIAIALGILVLAVVSYSVVALLNLDVLNPSVRIATDRILMFQVIGAVLAISFAWKVDR